ncbi:Uncharacterised protein [Mycobacterium tuberculosis]|nr:Uncharacterised protein [Mycobacterium tuberculosis]CPA11011.1 Uncharacterised protein [Mycobacterium tuberculosis]
MLNHTYSVPERLVQACLQVTEQVWQPMHLSRFITIAICAMTFIVSLRKRRSGPSLVSTALPGCGGAPRSPRHAGYRSDPGS